MERRYRRAYAADEPEGDGRHTRRRNSLDTLRQSPIRNGLIGLAVAGTAGQIAVNRYQQAMRTDPSHEDVLLRTSQAGATQGDVAHVWEGLASAEAAAQQTRDEAIAANLQSYSEYGLERVLAEQIYDSALEHRIDPNIAFGLVRAESSFKNSSTSPVGAIGLTQLMPKTASWLQPGVTKAQLREPGTNLRIGFKYLRQLIDKYEGDTKLALLAYNRGPGTVDRELKRGGNPDNGYADFVEGKEGHGHTLYARR
ncbi:MAG TPA: lytic transglycosylase domain-containing protein [Longimicrobiaceae bacterium]|nr:lytic transglycosylase domain-containing protein [Longimicrobiaceae bacterium]